MTDVIALSELSDEPVDRTGATNYFYGWRNVSPRLAAVYERLPVRNKTGTPIRIANALRNAGVHTLGELLSKSRLDLHKARDIGSQMIVDIEEALAAFGLYLRDVQPAVVVGDNARPIDAHLQRLQKWIEERIAECVAKQDEYGQAGSAHETTEQEVLTDVMLILDGREPLTKRRWYGCHDLDCEREYRHEGPHRRRTEVDGVEETEVWP